MELGKNQCRLEDMLETGEYQSYIMARREFLEFYTIFLEKERSHAICILFFFNFIYLRITGNS